MAADAPELLEGVITRGNMGRNWLEVASAAVEHGTTVDIVGICRKVGFHLYDPITDETRIVSAPTRSIFDTSPRVPRQYVDALVGSVSMKGIGVYRPSSLWQIRNERHLHPGVVTLGWIDYIEPRDIIHISPHPAED